MEKFNFYALKLSGIIAIIFLIQLLIPGFTNLFLLNQNSVPQIWRFVSAIFLHGSIVHLLYNLFALALFGSILERYIGGKKFLIVFFTTGILANLFSVNFYNSSLGASGAIFGVIGTLIIVKPTQFVWAFGLPMPIFIAGIVWAIGDLIGVFVPDNTANLAHLAGMFFGIILGVFLRPKRKRKNQAFIIDETKIQKWENNFLGK